MPRAITKLYNIVILNSVNGQEIRLKYPLEDPEAVEEAGEAWVASFPTDIVMFVEAS